MRRTTGDMLLFTLTTIASAVACALLLQTLAPAGQASPIEPLATRWLELTPAQRESLLATYTILAESPNKDDTLARVVMFQSASEQQRARWRTMYALLEDVLAHLPPPQRKDLLTMTERGRADAVHSLLETEQPNRLEELHRRWDIGS